MNKDNLNLLNLGAACLFVGAVFSIANGKTLCGISCFLSAACFLAVRRFCANQDDADKKKEENKYNRMAVSCIFILVSLLGVAGIINHLLNTGESLVEPICIAVFGAVAAVVLTENKESIEQTKQSFEESFRVGAYYNKQTRDDSGKSEKGRIRRY